MVGRDIGTVVLSDAGLKVYLDASVNVRARRRHEQLRNSGSDMTYETVLEDDCEVDRESDSPGLGYGFRSG